MKKVAVFISPLTVLVALFHLQRTLTPYINIQTALILSSCHDNYQTPPPTTGSRATDYGAHDPVFHIFDR